MLEQRLSALFGELLRVGTRVAVPAAALFLVIAAFGYMSAGSSLRNREGGRSAMYGVIVALVIILLALPIAQFVARAAGL